VGSGARGRTSRVTIARQPRGGDFLRLPRCLSSGLTPQGSGVRGRRARLSSPRKHARPRIPCSRLLGGWRGDGCRHGCAAEGTDGRPRCPLGPSSRIGREVMAAAKAEEVRIRGTVLLRQVLVTGGA
jgi:hypothetical protein